MFSPIFAVFIPKYDACDNECDDYEPDEERPPPRADGIDHCTHAVGRRKPEDERSVVAFFVAEFSFRRADSRETRDCRHIECDERDERRNGDARRAGVSTSIVYGYFKDKRDILFENWKNEIFLIIRLLCSREQQQPNRFPS